MIGQVLSCEKKKYQDREYYILCVRVDDLIGFISSPEPYEYDTEIELCLACNKDHKFIVVVAR